MRKRTKEETMSQFDDFSKEKVLIEKIRKTLDFNLLTRERLETIREIDKFHNEGKPSKGEYQLKFDEIIQDFHCHSK